MSDSAESIESGYDCQHRPGFPSPRTRRLERQPPLMRRQARRSDPSDIEPDVLPGRMDVTSGSVVTPAYSRPTPSAGGACLRKGSPPRKRDPASAKPRKVLQGHRTVGTSTANKRHEMGDTTCLVAKAGDSTAEERYSSSSLSVSVHRERRSVPSSKRLHPSTAPAERLAGVAGSAPESDSTSVVVEVHQKSRIADRRATVAPTTAKRSRPPQPENPVTDDEATSSYEVSSAVGLAPGSEKGIQKRLVNIDIEFNKATAVAGKQGTLLRSISMNIEKIVGRLLGPPRSDSHKPPDKGRTEESRPDSVPRGRRLGEKIAAAIGKAEGIALLGEKGLKEAQPIGQGKTSSSESLKRETIGAVPGVLDRFEDSLASQIHEVRGLAEMEKPKISKQMKKDKAELADTERSFPEGTEKKKKGGRKASKAEGDEEGDKSLVYGTADAVPSVLDKIEESLVAQIGAVKVLAEEEERELAKRRQAQKGDLVDEKAFSMDAVETKRKKKRRKTSKQMESEESTDMVKKKGKQKKGRMKVPKQMGSEEGRESVQIEATGGVPGVLDKIQESLVSQIDDVKVFAEEKGQQLPKRRKPSKAHPVGAEAAVPDEFEGMGGVPDVLYKIKESLMSQIDDVKDFAEAVRQEVPKRRKPSKAQAGGAETAAPDEVEATSEVPEVLDKIKESLVSQIDDMRGFAEVEGQELPKRREPSKAQPVDGESAVPVELGETGGVPGALDKNLESLVSQIDDVKVLAEVEGQEVPKHRKPSKAQPVDADAAVLKGRKIHKRRKPSKPHPVDAETTAPFEAEETKKKKAMKIPVEVEAEKGDDFPWPKAVSGVSGVLDKIHESLVSQIDEVKVLAKPRHLVTEAPASDAAKEKEEEAEKETEHKSSKRKKRKKKEKGDDHLGHSAAASVLGVPGEQPEVVYTKRPLKDSKWKPKDKEEDIEKLSVATALLQSESEEKPGIVPKSTKKKKLRKDRKGKKRRKQKEQDGSGKKTSVETGATADIAREHQARRRSSGGAASGDKEAEPKSELPVPKRSIIKGSSDQRRKSKELEGTATEDSQKLALATTSLHPFVPPSLDSAATGEGQEPTAHARKKASMSGPADAQELDKYLDTFESTAALPFKIHGTGPEESLAPAVDAYSEHAQDGKGIAAASSVPQLEPTALEEMDIYTATAPQAAKLKKGLRGKKRDQAGPAASGENTFKWSTSTLPSFMRELFFSTHRWGMGSPLTSEPSRGMKWSTSQVSTPSQAATPTVVSPPSQRRPSIVRICPQSISLKESRPPKPPGPKKKKRKKKHKSKRASLLKGASTASEATAPSTADVAGGASLSVAGISAPAFVPEFELAVQPAPVVTSDLKGVAAAPTLESAQTAAPRERGPASLGVSPVASAGDAAPTVGAADAGKKPTGAKSKKEKKSKKGSKRKKSRKKGKKRDGSKAREPKDKASEGGREAVVVAEVPGALAIVAPVDAVPAGEPKAVGAPKGELKMEGAPQGDVQPGIDQGTTAAKGQEPSATGHPSLAPADEAVPEVVAAEAEKKPTKAKDKKGKKSKKGSKRKKSRKKGKKKDGSKTAEGASKAVGVAELPGALAVAATVEAVFAGEVKAEGAPQGELKVGGTTQAETKPGLELGTAAAKEAEKGSQEPAEKEEKEQSEKGKKKKSSKGRKRRKGKGSKKDKRREGKGKKRRRESGSKEGPGDVVVVQQQGNQGLIAVCCLLSTVCLFILGVLTAYLLFHKVTPETTTVLFTLVTQTMSVPETTASSAVTVPELPVSRTTLGPPYEPTVEPVTESTVEPITEPTDEPITEPTVKPTVEPTFKPTVEPTVKPTAKPTVEPTAEPTIKPTAGPTAEPTMPTHMVMEGVYECSTEYCKREAAYLSRLNSDLSLTSAALYCCDLRTLLSASKTPACTDFYKHVCDGWSSLHRLPQFNNTFISTESLLEDKLAEDLLDAIIKADSEKDLRVARSVYDKCKDREKADSSKESIHAMFKAWSIGEWPLEPGRRQGDSKEVWNFAAELLRDLGLATLVSVDVGADPFAPDKPIAELAQPEPLFSAKSLQDVVVSNGVQSAFKEALDVLDRMPKDGAGFTAMSHSIANLFSKFGADPPDTRVEANAVTASQLAPSLQTFLSDLFGKDTNQWRVLVASPKYVSTKGVVKIVEETEQATMFNYMGLLALIRLAPYLPDKPNPVIQLRSLFSLSVMGRVRDDVADASVHTLCLRSTERLLPGCFAKAALRKLRSEGSDLTARQWLSQLMAVFARSVRELVWMDELSALFVRYRLKRRPVLRLTGFDGDGDCVPSAAASLSQSEPVNLYRDVASLLQRRIIDGIDKGDANPQRYPATSELHRYAVFDSSHSVVRVPSVLFNHSVPMSSTAFALHLSRLGVRFYRALVRVLFDDPYEQEAPLRDYGARAVSRIAVVDELRKCLLKDALHVYPDYSPLADNADVKKNLLDQATALDFAYRAFRELLHVRRIWNMDIRYEGLGNLSADHLFFVYFALDHCEVKDSLQEKAREYVLTPGQVVNLAVRSVPAFANTFNCSGDTVSNNDGAPVCRIFRVDTRRQRSGSGAHRRRKKMEHRGLTSMLDPQLVLG